MQYREFLQIPDDSSLLMPFSMHIIAGEELPEVSRAEDSANIE
jgi:hypothetical protein